MSEVAEESPNQAKLIYALYLGGLITGGVTTIIGVVMAYLARGDASDWLETHYTWLIRTFWLSFLYSLISAVLMMVLIGFLLMLVVLVWFIVRCVKGFQAVDKGEPISNVESWVI